MHKSSGQKEKWKNLLRNNCSEEEVGKNESALISRCWPEIVQTGYFLPGLDQKGTAFHFGRRGVAGLQESGFTFFICDGTKKEGAIFSIMP